MPLGVWHNALCCCCAILHCPSAAVPRAGTPTSGGCVCCLGCVTFPCPSPCLPACLPACLLASTPVLIGLHRLCGAPRLCVRATCWLCAPVALWAGPCHVLALRSCCALGWAMPRAGLTLLLHFGLDHATCWLCAPVAL